jgi:hypothetical protein
MARDKLFLLGEKAHHCRKHLARAGSGERGFPAGPAPAPGLSSARGRVAAVAPGAADRPRAGTGPAVGD